MLPTACDSSALAKNTSWNRLKKYTSILKPLWVPARGAIVPYLYILGAIAAFILFIACINFMNLATAKATVRTQEVGIRKVIGATRSALLKQFLSEAFLYTGFAILLAYGLARLALPTFNQLMDTQLSINPLEEHSMIVLFFGLHVAHYPISRGLSCCLHFFLPARTDIQRRVGQPVFCTKSAESIGGLPVFDFYCTHSGYIGYQSADEIRAQ